MKVRKTLIISFSSIVAAVILTALLSFALRVANKELQSHQQNRYVSYLLADELRQSSDDLTRLGRTYVLTGDEKYEKMYFDILDIRNGKKPRPQHYDRIYWDLVMNYGDKPQPDSSESVSLQELMKRAGFTDAEFAKLTEAQKNSDGLVKAETIAMNMVKGLYDDGTGNFTKKGEPDLEGAWKLTHNQDYHTFKASIMKPISEFQVILDERTGKDVEQSLKSSNRIFLAIQITLLGIIALSILIGVFVTRAIFREVGGEPSDISAMANRICMGDLTMPVESAQQQDTGVYAAMKAMIEKLRQVVGEVMSTADNVATGSRELSSSAMQMSQGATEQAASVEEISSSIEEMASSIRQNSYNAMQTEKISNKSSSDAIEGGKAVIETVAAMKEIAIKISIIEEIARQTNLLALNAAIEAARAGEHGKGFAVVASEVRKLAERSQTAAAEISSLSSRSVAIAEQAGDMLTRIVLDIQKTSELVQEITASSKEQDTGADQINKAIQQLDQVIQQNASASEEMASTSEELSSQAELLQHSISFFTIDGQKHHSMIAGSRKPAKKIPTADAKTAAALTKGVSSGGIHLQLGTAGPDHLDDEFEKF